MKKSFGFTLVELLISVSVLSIIAGLDVLLLQTALEAWTHSGSRLSLQRASDQLMDELLEGGFEGEGIRDAVTLLEADLSSIGFVPLWTDRSHHPDSVTNKDQKFTLEKQFKPGAPLPIGQVKRVGSANFDVVPVKFLYGDSRDPAGPDDVVQFISPILPLSEIRILYTPDGESDPEVVKRFRWDPAAQRIFESYGGKTRDILRYESNVKIQRCAFLYYDNLNRLIPLTEGETISGLSLKRATAVKLYLLLRVGTEWKELTSFTNIRNVASIGATITGGAVLPMPSPQRIKAFSIGDFYSLKREGIVELTVKSRIHRGWQVKLKFKPGQKEGDLVLERFQMESPPGKVVTSGILEQTISSNEFVNLLTLDRSGLYDYNDDEDVTDLVNVTGSSITVTVTRMDFEGASLFIRP